MDVVEVFLLEIMVDVDRKLQKGHDGSVSDFRIACMLSRVLL